MADRLSVINDALIATGNEARNEEYDGSAEWIAADTAFRRAVSWLIAKHPWNFATTSMPLASIVSVSPDAYRGFDKAYALPTDCLHVEGVNRHGLPFTGYDLVDNKICAPFSSGLTVKYVRIPAMEQWPAGFVELLTMKVEAHLLRSLNEDTANARQRDGDVEKELAELRAYSDQQEGRAVQLVSRSARARRGWRGHSRDGWR
jgi:hypothetical protein